MTTKNKKMPAIFCAIGCIICLGVVIGYQANLLRSKVMYKTLIEEGSSEEESKEQGNNRSEDVMQENKDVYAWITIPNTQINYPILQHATDDAYYLQRLVDGSKSKAGSIYTQLWNGLDFTDPNTVIYGHNMKNGTMFGELHLYEDVDFFHKNNYIYIYTLEQKLTYEIFAAYRDSDVHILATYDFSNQLIFETYLQNIFDKREMNANRREDMEVGFEDRIITLSTCVGNQADERFLVQAVLKSAENTIRE